MLPTSVAVVTIYINTYMDIILTNTVHMT